MGQPDAPALRLRDRVLSYAELEGNVARLAAWLARRVEKGARVASWAAKGRLTCVMPLAAARAGLVHVPINPLLKRSQVAHILADSGAELLVGNHGRLVTLEPGDFAGEIVDERVALEEADALSDGLEPGEGAPHDLAALLYTSGSTGRPKGVMLSHANLWLGAESVAQYLALEGSDRVLGVMPLSFDYGQNQLLSAWYAGASVVPLDYLFPRDLMKAVEEHRITTLGGMPPLWHQLLTLDWPDDAKASLRRLTNTGGAMGEALVRRLCDQFPDAALFSMYGLTEAFRAAYLDPALVDAKPTSVGRAVPHAELFVVDPAGEPVAADVEGELVQCGPLVAQGYWQAPEKTAERFRPAPRASQYGGTAVWSGDRMRRDADGDLHFVARDDAMIKSSGNRISPQEIEEAAMGSGLVRQAIAFGLPDKALGHRIALVVSADVERAEELSDILRKELPTFMQPHVIKWRDSLPHTPNGKLDRKRVLAELAS
ncbi:acyl-CoA ligase (AMP-forming), exosortase A system-associated [Blastomonas marina]|uniref:Acyl-CoA ligase (AMP-forming), exosortase A system-associated n=2 Tax=Blastomonas marina TaxID=1867408 RepID=A0ABQ1FBM1_9SPHN|nr:acyl-CoA ligase (AMP-forming), exosortase A system-associated [Blastomonas marina]